ncbi:alpha-amylase family glycosyl hydrolase [Archaeoglobus veneficus]|uniref:Alpha amylase catalytic region n=1 Tax=Archaeoglobus veneficus (strain DSM 11195 / SNP6) TaxID=693661 RepID=F2KSS3_ARCVS|nr:alpha-amylase family glycosyl hydrolase [Archaeoglobus veneficus]AEA46968.1 alpha amylase catalytic region [Archaeoglobus veneficus SNP6]
MLSSIRDPKIREVIEKAKSRHKERVLVNGEIREIPKPFPSPEDWRDTWIYFIMVDRFNSSEEPKHEWNSECGVFQGGNLKGIQSKLGYLERLGVGAIWLSPVFKNCQYDDATYHGYGIQNFLEIDPRFGSEEDLQQLIDEAHARGIYVILDVVLNHAGDVFEYEGHRHSAPWRGYPYRIYWRDEEGKGRWEDAPKKCHRDAAVYPDELRRNRYFRRQGKGGNVGDFESLKEFVTEYAEITPERGYYHPVRDILIKAYQYAIAKFDIDGFRIDTLKYVERYFARIFGNAMREFALSIGKRNFFTFGEVWDNEEKIARYIGRSATDADDLIGVDAALDFPLFHRLPAVVKGFLPPSELARMFEHRKKVQRGLLCSHGESSRYFVTFLDNHDQHSRFYPGDGRYDAQLTMGIACLFALQGIPCIYYGTEQGLHGSGNRDLSVREALWGKPNAFNEEHPFYKAVQEISKLRSTYAALRYGRQYFREVSGDGKGFGISTTQSGILAFSRILNDSEVVTIANTSNDNWSGYVLVDFALNPEGKVYTILYSNFGTKGQSKVVETGGVRALYANLKPMEVQVFGPGHTVERSSSSVDSAKMQVRVQERFPFCFGRHSTRSKQSYAPTIEKLISVVRNVGDDGENIRCL